MRKSTTIVAAGLVLLGLGLTGAFMLPSSGAQGTVSYTYPTKPPPTTAPAETTTADTTTTEPATTVATTTAPVIATTAPETTPTLSLPSTQLRIRSVRNAKLRVAILVDPRGMTLYHPITEKARKPSCVGVCARLWPPLVLPRGATLAAGTGVNRQRLRTIRRADGRLQLTYAGLALYRYSGDRKPGDTTGQGVGKIWYAVGANGRLVKSSAVTGGYGG
jgi:predicted lipoprotein with Yx(FWY)xxD motif